MGIERMHSPKYWLMRAEEFHAKADNCEHAHTRATLRQVAKNYETIARRAEKILTEIELDERHRLEARRVGKNTPTTSALSESTYANG
jgi:hypothetical protein